MKKYFLLIPFWLLATTAFAQQSDFYLKEWLEIDSLFLNHQTTAAYHALNLLSQKATKQNNWAQEIKTLLFKSVKNPIDTDGTSRDNREGVVSAVNRLREGADKTHSPVKSVLQSVLGELFWHFAKEKVNFNPKNQIWAADDMRGMDKNQLLKTALAYYKASLQDEQTKQLPIQLLDALTLPNLQQEDAARPTVYDFLAHRTLDFCISSEYLDRTFYEDLSNRIALNENMYAPTDVFLKENFDTQAIGETGQLLFKTLQNLLFFHKNDTNKTAFLEIEKRRFTHFMHYAFPYKKEKAYLNGLNSLIETYRDTPSVLSVVDALAIFYKTKGFKFKTESYDFNPYYPVENQPENRFYLQKAYNLCTHFLEKYPNAYGKKLLETHIFDIKRQSLLVESEEVILPNKPILFKVSFRNIDTVFCRLVQFSATDTLRFKTHEDKMRFYRNQTVIRTWTQPLPVLTDFQTHETEAITDGLPIGHYALLVSDNMSFEQKDSLTRLDTLSAKGGNLCISPLIISELAAADNQYGSIIVTHRETGKPLPNVLFEFNRTKTDAKLDKTEIVKTNTEGVIHEEFEAGEILVLGKDTLPFSSIKSRNENDEQKLKILFYTDRNIYRPAQTIHFKGIMVDEKRRGQARIWKNQTVKVIFSERHDEDTPIDTLRLITNEFGSFSGSFKAPMNGQLGEFQLLAGPVFDDEDKEEIFEDSYDIRDEDVETYFRIEEYKRPRFELVFEPQNQAYKMGDTVRVKGQAVSLAGTVLDDVTVNYRLSQNLQSGFAKDKNKQFPSKYFYGNSTREDTLKTDKNGRFTIEFVAKPHKNDNVLAADFYLNYRYNVYATAVDLNGESQNASLNLAVNSTNLVFNLQIPPYLNRKKDIAIPLSNIFGNASKMPVQGSIQIKKISSLPVFQKRYWAVPDTFLYDKTTFSKHFPEMFYPFDADKTQQDTTVVFIKTFNSAAEKAVLLIADPDKVGRGIENWQVGQYVLTMTVFDNFLKDSISKTANFELIDVKNKQFSPSNDLRVILSKTDYFVGDKVKMNIAAPYKEGFVWLELIRHDSVFKTAWLTLKNGFAEYDYTLKEADRAGFSYTVSMVKNNRAYTDVGHILVQQTDKNLNIEVLTFRNRLTPAAQETWTFRVTDAHKKPVSAEMVATLYDASLDLLEGNSSLSYQNNLYSYYQNRADVLDWDGFSDNRSHNLKQELTKTQYSQLKNVFFQRSPRLFHWFGIEEYGMYEKNLLDYFMGDMSAKAMIWRLRGSTHYKNGVLIKPYIKILNDSTVILDGVTVVGYGSLSKKAMTGAVSNIQIRGISSLDNDLSIDGILQGRMAGVSIEQSSVLSEVVVVGYGTLKMLRVVDDKTSSNFKARTNLKETVFFFPHLKTDENGEVKLSFTMNEALTRWRFLAFAHTKDLKMGNINKTIVTQKDLMVFPNMPRFLREGDEIELTAKIANLKTDSTILHGVAQLFLFNEKMQPIDNQFNIKISKQNWAIKAGQSTVVKWRIKVPNTDSLKSLTWRIMANSDNLSDGEEGIIPILPQRILVTETLPFTLDPKNSENTEGGVFNPNFKNLETQSTTLQPYSWSMDIVTNPIWQAITALHYAKEYPYECSEQLFSRFYANALAHKILKENPQIKDFLKAKQASNKEHQAEIDPIRQTLQEESPWLFASEGFNIGRLAPLFDTVYMAIEQQKALEKLLTRANYSGGFSWFPNSDPNQFITQHIVAGFGHLEKLNVHFDKKQEIDKVLNKSLDYLDGQTILFYKTQSTTPKDTNLLLHYLYARSFYPKRLISNDLQEAITRTTLWAKRNWIFLSRYDKVLTSLVLHRLGEKTLAQQIANFIKNEPEPTFWTARNYRYWYEMPVETMSLTMEMYQEVTKDTPSRNNRDVPSVQTLKIKLLNQLENGHWSSTKATTEAVYALMLLGGPQKAVKNSVVDIETPNLALKKAIETESQKENFIHISLKNTDITKDLNQTIFKNNGEWALNGNVTLRYTENMNQVAAFSNDTFTRLEKHIFKTRFENGDEMLDTLKPNTPLSIGDHLRVVLSFKVGKKLEYVHLKDTRPAAFEPTEVVSDRHYLHPTSYYKTTRDVSTNYFFDYLPIGSYEVEYDITVQQRGIFTGGLASMECMYAPNLGLHTEGVVIEVK